MPSVSVIVPIYQVEDYLKRCLETLVNQTLEDIEIILVNDGSTDRSAEIAKEYQEKYRTKIRYVEKENGGLSDARNFGMQYAKGEYVAFLDSDDYVELSTYQDMYMLAKKEKSDLVECDFIWEYPHKQKEDIGQIYQGKHEMLEKVRVVAWNKLIKREILEKTKVKFPKGYHYEDVEFTYQLIPHLEIISFLKKPCIHYIQRENSISNSQNERTKEIFDVLEHVLKYYQENQIFETYQEELEYLYTRYALCSSFLRIVKVKDKTIRKQLLDLTFEKLNTKFPNWKKNKILLHRKSSKNFYMRTVNSFTYKIYAFFFRMIG